MVSASTAREVDLDGPPIAVLGRVRRAVGARRPTARSTGSRTAGWRRSSTSQARRAVQPVGGRRRRCGRSTTAPARSSASIPRGEGRREGRGRRRAGGHGVRGDDGLDRQPPRPRAGRASTRARNRGAQGRDPRRRRSARADRRPRRRASGSPAAAPTSCASIHATGACKRTIEIGGSGIDVVVAGGRARGSRAAASAVDPTGLPTMEALRLVTPGGNGRRASTRPIASTSTGCSAIGGHAWLADTTEGVVYRS